MIKKIFGFVALFIAIYIILNFQLVLYGIRQLKGQLHIIINTRPVEDVISEKSVSAEYISKLLLIQNIRQYAIDSLGLINSSNYTTFYDQQNKPVLWVLTACPPFKMEPYEWNFPFLGNVSYKGFFRKELGIAEEKKLKDAFFDTDLSPTGGWSTLGWFKDPVLSNMLKRSNGQLAELIIHELTHATVYISGGVEYNENLATFIGEQGAIRFLKSMYGDSSADLHSYLSYKSDEDVYGEYMLHACNRLDSLYLTFSDEPFRLKLQLKYQLITEIITNISHLNLHYPEKYKFRFPVSHLPNNTWFLSFKRYRSKQNDMEIKLNRQYHGDLRAYIQSIKNR